MPIEFRMHPKTHKLYPVHVPVQAPQPEPPKEQQAPQKRGPGRPPKKR